MANYNKLTEDKYNAIKSMLKGGAPVADICRYMQISNGTVYQISKRDTWEKYREWSEGRTREARKRKEAIKTAVKPAEVETPRVVQQSVTIQATHYMMEELRKTNELLTLISAKIVFIVDELCGTPPKKEG